MLTLARAKFVLRYSESEGKLYWKRNVGTRAIVGKEVGGAALLGRKRTYYRTFQVDGKRYLTHRVIWLMHHGDWPKNMIDHRDRSGLNNKIGNLRDTSGSNNSLNRLVCDRRSRGVYKAKKTGRWIAEIKRNMIRTYLGSFSFKREAIAARQLAEINYEDFGPSL